MVGSSASDADDLPEAHLEEEAEIQAALGYGSSDEYGYEEVEADEDEENEEIVNGEITTRGSVVVVAGKRQVEISDDDQDGGNGDRMRRKKAKVDSWEEEDMHDMEIEYDSEVDEPEGSNTRVNLPAGDGPTMGQGRKSRRKFYFEDSSSESDTEDEDEPTALLTVIRYKNAHRTKIATAKNDPSAPEPLKDVERKGGRGKAHPLVNNPYRELLNEAINDARTRTVYPDVRFKSSEIEGIFWTTVEKQRFFRALPRLGRHNPVALAREVRTKSVIEVQGYLNALKRELERRLELVGVSRYTLLMMEDIPAAVEVSEECERALEAEADRVVEYIEKIEEKEATARWGDEGAVLDAEMALEIKREKYLGDKPGDAPGKASLLASWNWLLLSERIFMASENDRILARPAIHKQTVEDLNLLVKSVTQRLVQISLYQAHCRLKNCQSVRYPGPGLKEVNTRDIAAALKLLGMPTSSEEYWRKVPRRFQLNVLDDNATTKRGAKPDFMSYDDVEETLKVFEDIRFYRNATEENGYSEDELPAEPLEPAKDWETDDDIEEEETETEEESDRSEVGDDNGQETETSGRNSAQKRCGKSALAKYLETPINLERFLVAPPVGRLKKRQKMDILDELHFINDDEEYLNGVDKFYSLREEKKLWKLLGGWADKKEEMQRNIKDAEYQIPDEPSLLGFRRLEKWRRDEWRAEAGQMVPIWQQRYYRRLWEREKVVRVQKSQKQAAKQKKDNGSVYDQQQGGSNDSEVQADSEDDEDRSGLSEDGSSDVS